MSQDGIAIIGMACCYPDANSPAELWENSLAQRQAFRRIPEQRLSGDYFSPDSAVPDRSYSRVAALIEGYAFDRARFDISGESFRSADMTHWLALDVCGKALFDAGLSRNGFPKDSTGVFLGNTLAGEFSRANNMRLRWPYVKRVLRNGLEQAGHPDGLTSDLLDALEPHYKLPFPPINAESLAGGMSNTIAGRICNYFDLKGGGYSVDGACASSLLAVVSGCNALISQDLDVAIVGGVDLSLDPFELVGFAKAGALATGQMRVFDRRACGFWPGEGCGFLVLMRLGDALDRDHTVQGVIRGWAVSSDGHGGMTRPEVAGQILALQRAYRRAGFGIDTVPYFEGHGTGTAVGDSVELAALAQCLRESGSSGLHVVGSVKSIIGHTKAAAGVAGLIRATKALAAQTLPATPGFEQPNSILSAPDSRLSVLQQPKWWPPNQPLRAGVSAFGFGGINSHVVLESAPATRGGSFSVRDQHVANSKQDSEIFFLEADSKPSLLLLLDRLFSYASRLSQAQLGDLSNSLFLSLVAGRSGPVWRAAVVAGDPEELASQLEQLRNRLLVQEHPTEIAPTIGFVFPGQGAPLYESGGVWSRRFPSVSDIYAGAEKLIADSTGRSERAQLGVATSTLAGLRVLSQLGILASVSVGHSLGELAGLHWAGAFDESTLLRMVQERGRSMDNHAEESGAMASVAGSPQDIAGFLNNRVWIANLNSPRQTVVAGNRSAVQGVVDRARSAGFQASILPVAHAFHSPLMDRAVPPFAEFLGGLQLSALRAHVISTVTGADLSRTTDIRTHLVEQIVSPVNFVGAMKSAIPLASLWIEVGPGRVAGELARACGVAQAISLDVGGTSLKGLLQLCAQCHSRNVNFDRAPLFSERFFRPFDLDWRPSFFSNPCEALAEVHKSVPEPAAASPLPSVASDATPLEVVRQLAARRTELPAAQISDNCRLLTDLHLNSIVVGQIVSEAFHHFDLSAPMAPTEYADAKLSEIADVIEEQIRIGPQQEPNRVPAGIASWTRCFVTDLVPKALRRANSTVSGEVRNNWVIFSDPSTMGFAEDLKACLPVCNGSAVLLCCSSRPTEDHIELLLQAARLALSRREDARFVVVQSTGGATALAKTLHLEATEITCCVVNVPELSERVVPWVVNEAASASGFVEAHYDIDGNRSIPLLRPLPFRSSEQQSVLVPGDVAFVTGGGKGIGAEIALQLAENAGIRLALLGRADPSEDVVLQENLERFRALGINFIYCQGDVTDAQDVLAAVERTRVELGPISAVIHAAGANRPQLLASLDKASFAATLAPKTLGLKNLLATVPSDSLRILVAFGSIISRTGFRGEADYGVANEWLRMEVVRWKAENPHKHALVLESSVWSSTGMGQRLGTLDSLLRQGVSPIAIEDGVRLAADLISHPVGHTDVVMTGRFGNLPTLTAESVELPLLRFLDRIRVSVRDVELISEVELSTDTDPYLMDHVFDGEYLLPGVIGLEAMCQVAMTLLETTTPLVAEGVEFQHPIVVPEGRKITIRIVALVEGQGECSVAIRHSESAFQVDHFRARFRRAGSPREPLSIDPLPLTSVMNGNELYDELLFHSGRFRRVDQYCVLGAKHCTVRLSPTTPTNWFGTFLPQPLVLGDAAARDAAVHAIQACIPHAVVLPVGADLIEAYPLPFSEPLVVSATQVRQNGDLYHYDVTISREDGVVLERWSGLRLRRVRDVAMRNWNSATVRPYFERSLEENFGIRAIKVTIGVKCSSKDLTRLLLPEGDSMFRMPNGKLITRSKIYVSVSNDDDISCAVASSSPVGCDVETVEPRDRHLWLDLLGSSRFALALALAEGSGITLDEAATRLWSAVEALIKTGASVDGPLTVDNISTKGWISLRSGIYLIPTIAAWICGAPRVTAIAVRCSNASGEESLCATTNTAT